MCGGECVCCACCAPLLGPAAGTLASAAAKVVLGKAAERIFDSFKRVKARKIPLERAGDVEQWLQMLKLQEAYAEPKDGREAARTAVRLAQHDEYRTAAQTRLDEYEKLILNERSKEDKLLNEAGQCAAEDGNSVALKLSLELTAKKHRADAECLASLHQIAKGEVDEPFVDRDTQTIFDCSREDVHCRALILLLQYSLVLYKKQEYESRTNLILAISNCDKVVKNRHHSRVFNRHLWRELIIDSISLQTWRDLPGHYWNWRRRVCVNPDTVSAQLLMLLLARTMRHIALLLEGIRSQEYSLKIKEKFLDDTLAVNRFERSLLWETTCDIGVTIKGHTVDNLWPYEYPNELSYPTTKKNDLFEISPEEKERVKKCGEIYKEMVNKTARLVQGVADTTKRAVPRSIENSDLSDEPYSDFKSLVRMFEKCSTAIRDRGSKQKHHLQKYASRVIELTANMLAYHYRQDQLFESNAAKLRETVSTLKSYF